jgi:hypothetical protein
MSLPVFVTIPVYRPSIADACECIEAMGIEPTRVIVVANGQNPPTRRELPAGVILTVDSNPYGGINISRWWNTGLRIASLAAEGDHATLVINADARIDRAGIDTLAHTIDLTGVAAAYPSLHGLPSHTNYRPEEVDLRTRLTGFCFMLRGDGVRADERFAWWYGDDDIDWQARVAGGSRMVTGVHVTHPAMGGTDTEALAETIRVDRARFVAKWGRAPHGAGAVRGELTEPYRG